MGAGSLICVFSASSMGDVSAGLCPAPLEPDAAATCSCTDANSWVALFNEVSTLSGEEELAAISVAYRSEMLARSSCSGSAGAAPGGGIVGAAPPCCFQAFLLSFMWVLTRWSSLLASLGKPSESGVPPFAAATTLASAFSSQFRKFLSVPFSCVCEERAWLAEGRSARGGGCVCASEATPALSPANITPAATLRPRYPISHLHL